MSSYDPGRVNQSILESQRKRTDERRAEAHESLAVIRHLETTTRVKKDDLPRGDDDIMFELAQEFEKWTIDKRAAERIIRKHAIIRQQQREEKSKESQASKGSKAGKGQASKGSPAGKGQATKGTQAGKGQTPKGSHAEKGQPSNGRGR